MTMTRPAAEAVNKDCARQQLTLMRARHEVLRGALRRVVTQQVREFTARERQNRNYKNCESPMPLPDYPRQPRIQR